MGIYQGVEKATSTQLENEFTTNVNNIIILL